MNEIWELAHYDVTFLELELEFLEIPSATISYSGFNTDYNTGSWNQPIRMLERGHVLLL